MEANAALRSRVEAIFQQRFPDGVAQEKRMARNGFADMLVALGLKKPEAEAFLEAWDPERSSCLNYVEFLDFLFSPSCEGAGGAEGPSKSGIVPPPGLAVEPADISEDKAETEVKAEVEAKNRESPAAGEASAKALPESDAVALAAAEASAKAQPEGDAEAPGEASTDVSAKVTTEDATEVNAEAKANLKAEVKIEGLKREDRKQSMDSADAVGSEPSQASSSRRPRQCAQCNAMAEVYLDASDGQWYCENCWVAYYGTLPSQGQPHVATPPEKLFSFTTTRIWTEEELQSSWRAAPMKDWPPTLPPCSPVPGAAPTMRHGGGANEIWSGVKLRVVPDLVGSHARECTRRDRPYGNEILAGRYRVASCVGAGQFTRALLATDLTTGDKVCVKRHNGISVELLSDLLSIARRLEVVDPQGEHFPRMFDAFFDMSGFTVETFIEGRNCLDVMRADASHFAQAENLRLVACGVLQGLALLAKAGVVHADVKADNILWSEEPGRPPRARLVDFGCARLDRSIEGGRNWSLAEGGAGHIGKWGPEMVLRLPITNRADVWGLGVVLLELHTGRFLWCCEEDSVEVVLAQVLGIVDARDGLPADLLRRSPLDITRLYSPSPQHFPVRRVHGRRRLLEELRPTSWGLSSLLGSKAKEKPWSDLQDLVLSAMSVDHEVRPSAAELLRHRFCACAEDPSKETVVGGGAE